MKVMDSVTVFWYSSRSPCSSTGVTSMESEESVLFLQKPARMDVTRENWEGEKKGNTYFRRLHTNHQGKWGSVTNRQMKKPLMLHKNSKIPSAREPIGKMSPLNDEVVCEGVEKLSG